MNEVTFEMNYLRGDGRVLHGERYDKSYHEHAWGNPNYHFENDESGPFMPRNYTRSEWSDDPMDAASVIRALSGLIVALLLYFCAMCFCDKQRESSKREVDRCIIVKKVEPHGQSQGLVRRGLDEKTTGNTACRWCPISRCCSKQQKESADPYEQSAEKIMEEYRSKSLVRYRNHGQSNNICNEADRHQTVLELEENGLCENHDLNICPICIEPVDAGEPVVWSRTGHCGHVFHYNCILPWVALGNIECPVCSRQSASSETEWSETRMVTYDELELAEEGLSMHFSDNICPICIEPFNVGEQVAWSSLGNCQHAFHYECILRWAVLGNVECPVCRETYWTKVGMNNCAPCHNIDLGSDRHLCCGHGGSLGPEMRRRRFCVEHGLILPQEE